jgi:hypothetical protein
MSKAIVQTDSKVVRDPEPRWLALIAALAVGALEYVLPEPLTVGPGWVALAIAVILLIPTMISHRTGNVRMNDIFGYSVLVALTLMVASSLGLLIMRLPGKADSPIELLRSAGALWGSNILLFASWYWRLDGGGPNERIKRAVHDGAFLFPQMMMDEKLRRELGEENWRPGFVDYLFLAFNTSTAFSPTDVPVLSRWAKVMMMVQSVISLSTLALIAARAVNIL